MSEIHYLIIIITTFLLISSINIVRSDQTVDVRIKNGIVHGKRDRVDARDQNVFLGIPYAQPPIGDLRFKKPLPVQQWSEPIEAYNWPKPCLQRPLFPSTYFKNTDWSEDCLYLNIWSPLMPEINIELKSVMFFIHGGALLIGSSNEYYYSGHELASKGDVVVVTFNYRLNIFGFLYTGTDDAPGNMGLWDQALALEWVNDNIAYFGGDPKRITIFGESAGGWSTSLHILSPVTRNMYQNAIVMSGAVMNNQTVCESQAMIDMWVNAAKSVGCDDQRQQESSVESKSKFTPEMIECLRTTSVEKLANIQKVVVRPVCMTQVVVDGQFLPDMPIKMFRSGDYKKNFNLMIGSVEDEGSFLLAFVDPVKYNPVTPEPIVYKEAYNGLKRLTQEIFEINNENVAKIYFNGLSDNNSADMLRRTMGIAIGDYLLGCHTLLFAKNVYKNDPDSNVYQYYYTSKLGEIKPYCSQWMGSCHFGDIFPVFAVPFADYDRHVDREREISAQMIDIFSTFAKTGRPSRQSGAEWEKYYTIDDQIIAPYYEITNEKEKSKFDIGLKIIECDYLWKKYIERQ